VRYGIGKFHASNSTLADPPEKFFLSCFPLAKPTISDHEVGENIEVAKLLNVKQNQTTRRMGRFGSSLIVGMAVFGAARLLRLHQIGGNDWITGDWLINYESGFIRRGLSGSIILVASDSSNGNPIFVTGIFLAILWFATCIAVLSIWKKSAPNFGRLAVLMSPGFLAFDIWDFQGGARKELIFFAFLAIMLATHQRSHQHRFWRRVWISTFALVPAFLILMHEMLALFIPLLMVVFYLLSQKYDAPASERFIFYSTLSLTSFASVMAVVLHPGTVVQGKIICESLTERGTTEFICPGAISWLGRTPAEEIVSLQEYASSPFRLTMYAITVGMSLIPFLYFRSRRHGARISPYLLMSLATAALIPLFAIGLDWGRWIHLASASWSIIILGIPSLFKPRPFARILQASRDTTVKTTAIFLFALSWSIDHFNGNDIYPGVIRLAEAFNIERFFP